VYSFHIFSSILIGNARILLYKLFNWNIVGCTWVFLALRHLINQLLVFLISIYFFFLRFAITLLIFLNSCLLSLAISLFAKWLIFFYLLLFLFFLLLLLQEHDLLLLLFLLLCLFCKLFLFFSFHFIRVVSFPKLIEKRLLLLNNRLAISCLVQVNYFTGVFLNLFFCWQILI
jgi:hypothetical protein